MLPPRFLFFFFFNDTATTEIYTLSLHDALPISRYQERTPAYIVRLQSAVSLRDRARGLVSPRVAMASTCVRSEEHTSELQSRLHLVCRLLLEKKKKIKIK